MPSSSDNSSQSAWNSFWQGITPENEIRMWDFYGGRPWILKYIPRYGKVLEAGCGLGRYVFYLSRLGIDIEGLDFHESTVERIRRWAKNAVKRLIGRSVMDQPFFQYWYTPTRLRSFVLASGLQVTISGGCDLKYAFWELGWRRDQAFKLADYLEKTPLRCWGAQSLTVSVKVAEVMHCFLCGKNRAKEESLKSFCVPICSECRDSALTYYYRRSVLPRFHSTWEYRPGVTKLPFKHHSCFFCGQAFYEDPLFEDFGFCVPIYSDCLKNPYVNIEAANQYIQPRWRVRSKGKA